ncbi:MAG: TIR domain-containing protein, partial [Lewinellaceae bacterium]|nr:TIR domain-containing protein [Lewinellaceae bacterium]
MPTFDYDVFLSHSQKDSPTALDIAERLRKDGLRVWLAEWELQPGDDRAAKIEAGLEQSRVLVLCLSKNAYGKEWPELEAQTLRFRDPAHLERRFVPIRLDDAEVPEEVSGVRALPWSGEEGEYGKILHSCQEQSIGVTNERLIESVDFTLGNTAVKHIQLDPKKIGSLDINVYAFNSDAKWLLTGAHGNRIQLWDLETEKLLRDFPRNTSIICSLELNRDQSLLLSGDHAGNVHLWDVDSGKCLQIFKGHVSGELQGLAWHADQTTFLSCSGDNAIRRWDRTNGQCLQVYKGHTSWVWDVVWNSDQRKFLSCSSDKTARLWDSKTGKCLVVFEGHTRSVKVIECGTDPRYFFTGSFDNTLRHWDSETGQTLQVFEG